MIWAHWMQQVMLYYYYRRSWHRPALGQALAEILVACEQFEAYSISVVDGATMCGRRKRWSRLAYLEKLQQEGILSGAVMRRWPVDGARQSRCNSGGARGCVFTREDDGRSERWIVKCGQDCVVAFTMQGTRRSKILQVCGRRPDGYRVAAGS